MGLPTGAKGIGSLIGGLGSLFGGGGGGSAGLSPEEASLMEFQRQQQILAKNSQGASSGTGIGTGTTYADAAAGVGAAATGAGIVDQQLAAEQAAQQSSLQALASGAGFGTQSGQNTNVNPTPPVTAA